MVELAEEINTAAPLYVATRIWGALNDQRIAVNGAKVLLVGVTYKPDVADLSESPARPLAERLQAWGAALAYHDPCVPRWRVPSLHRPFTLNSSPDIYEAASGADLVVLLQPHVAYDLEKLSAASSLLLDTRGLVSEADNVRRL